MPGAANTLLADPPTHLRLTDVVTLGSGRADRPAVEGGESLDRNAPGVRRTSRAHRTTYAIFVS